MGWKRYMDISKKTPWLHEEAVWKRVYQNRNKWSEIETVDAYLYIKKYTIEKSFNKVVYEMREMENLLPKYKHLIKK